MVFHKGIAIKCLVVLLCMGCNFLFVSGKVRCIEREREALLKLKTGLIDSYGYLSTWSGAEDCCNWRGVWCSNTTGHVIALQLYYMGGEINPALLELPYLNYLDLESNNFTGRIPEFIGSMKQLEFLILRYSYFSGIPSQLGNLTNLRLLDLSYNYFWGSRIPGFIGSMKKLEFLNLQYSYFSGMIPSQLGNLTNLRTLDLAYNFFGGSRIPEFIGSMKQLEYLNLQYSNFSGAIPPQLGNLTNLRALNLSFNHFDGNRIPESIGSMKQLEYLNLQSSNFSGAIPPQLGNLTNLRALDLSLNHFDGNRIPESIGSMKKLEFLNLQYSNFSGMIPSQLGNLTNLRTLDLAYNFFGGSRIPEFIGSMKQLEYLNLQYSNFSGAIPPQLGNLTNLRALNLSLNHFDGNRIPESIGSMKQLEYLNLQSSNFSGVIPPQLGNLTNLRTLDLSLNSYLRSENLNWLSSLSQLSVLNLTGANLSDTNWLQPIPMLHSLQILNLQSCSLAGVVPSPGLLANFSSSSLSVLYLQYNKLTSSVFDWLFNISASLVTLDLSNNILAGPIPDSFGRLVVLEHLEISSNMLEGEIPKSLGNSSHLQIISLSDNRLRGSPDRLIGNVSCKAMLSLEYVELSFNQFTGPVPDMRACPSLKGVSFSRNNLTGSLPLSLGELSKLEILDLSYNSLEDTISEANFIKLHGLKGLVLSFNSLTMRIAPDWSPPFQLLELDLAYCKMWGHFPEWIQTQSNLLGFRLSDTGISGELPQWLWSFSSKLRALDISLNQIDGTIPDLSSTSITFMDFRSNKFSGPIPSFPPNTTSILLSQNMFSGSISSICTIPHLDKIARIDLSNNQLDGELLNCWEKMQSLRYLNLANNTFSGEIPHSLGTLKYLRTLHLHDNNLSGQVLSTMRNCRYLRLIDIGGNKLTGDLSWIGADYSSVHYLMLGDNRFYGSIPPDICNLTLLRVLDLSRNNFSGKIPDCFNNFTIMSGNYIYDSSFQSFYTPFIFDFHVHYMFTPQWNFESGFVQWKGNEAEYIKTLDQLTLIDLSSNKLVGSIPASFSHLKSLRSLNLSRNSLRGNIIPGIGDMKMLETLDLSRNQLSGKIPVGLAQLNFLSFLDLANNNLSGQIPSSTQLHSFDPSAYAGNDGLCGAPLPLCFDDTNPEENPNKKDSGFAGLSSGQEMFITVFLGFFVGFWGLVGSLVLKRSWRSAYFNLLNAVGDWIYVSTTLFLNKFRRG